MVYTKKGDNGYTSNFAGDRIIKSDEYINLVGEIDELNSFLSFAKIVQDMNIDEIILQVQKELHNIMGYISNNFNNEYSPDIIFLENKIDYFDGQLPKIKEFIISANNEKMARLDMARTKCRAVERTFASSELPLELKSYINRLSDLLFVLGRFAGIK